MDRDEVVKGLERLSADTRERAYEEALGIIQQEHGKRIAALEAEVADLKQRYWECDLARINSQVENKRLRESPSLVVGRSGTPAGNKPECHEGSSPSAPPMADPNSYEARLVVDAAALHLADEQTVRNMERRILALESEQRDYERTCVRLNAKLARVREVEATMDTGTDALLDVRDKLRTAIADEATAAPSTKPIAPIIDGVCDECGFVRARGNVVYEDSGRRPLCKSCNEPPATP